MISGENHYRNILSFEVLNLFYLQLLAKYVNFAKIVNKWIDTDINEKNIDQFTYSSVFLYLFTNYNSY